MDAPDVSERNKDESETEQEGVKCQLSSSVIVDMPNVQASLELSTITGAAKAGVVMRVSRTSDQTRSARLSSPCPNPACLSCSHPAFFLSSSPVNSKDLETCKSEKEDVEEIKPADTVIPNSMFIFKHDNP